MQKWKREVAVLYAMWQYRISEDCTGSDCSSDRRIVMTKYAGREYQRYALIAGFCEIGETAEDTVRREVMEEVGLKVKNLRYYKSQPWGFDSNLLMGFFAELDGDDTIVRQEDELSVAEWKSRTDAVGMDDGISLTREMMRIFAEGEEVWGS